MLFRIIITIYFKNNLKDVNAICDQSAELWNVKVGEACGYLWL